MNEIEQEMPPKNRTVRYLKKIGVLGFLFFLGKGILWILVFYGVFGSFKNCNP